MSWTCNECALYLSEMPTACPRCGGIKMPERADLRRLRPEPSSFVYLEMQERIARLEAELAQARAERDRLLEVVRDYLFGGACENRNQARDVIRAIEEREYAAERALAEVRRGETHETAWRGPDAPAEERS